MPTGAALDNSMGAYLIALLLSTTIYGVTCLQVYTYFTESLVQDPFVLKAFVCFLMVLDTVHVSVISQGLYQYVIKDFGEYSKLGDIIWSQLAEMVLGTMITCSVECFFAYRVYHLSGNKNWWTPLIICLLSMGVAIGGFGVFVTGIKVATFARLGEALVWEILGFSTEIMADLLISGSIMYYLRMRRSNSHFKSTNRALSKLLTFSLITCILPTIFAMLTLIIFSVWPRTLLRLPPFFVLGRLYSCSFMTLLNSRKKVRAEFNDIRADETIPMGTMPITSRSGSDGRKARSFEFSATRPAEITVHKADMASGDL